MKVPTQNSVSGPAPAPAPAFFTSGSGQPGQGQVQPGQAQRLKNWLRRGEWGPLPVVIGLLLIWGFFQSQNQNFLSPRNLSNLALQIGVVGTLAVGVVFVLLLGEIDLSLGSVCGVCAGVLGVLVVKEQWPGPLAIGAALGVGALIGLLQGFITVYFGIPSFIVTLAGLLAWEGVQLILLGSAGELLIQDQTVRSLSSEYLTTFQSVIAALLAFGLAAAVLFASRRARQRAGLPVPPQRGLLIQLGLIALGLTAVIGWFDAYFGVPYMLVLLLLISAGCAWLTNRTVLGRYIYAIGGSVEAARRAGIPVGWVKVGVFSITGCLAAVGGVLSASRQFAVSTGTGGGTLLLEAIAAAVIGGTSLFGGRGQIYHALLGALVIGSVANGLDLLGQSASTKNIGTAIILVIAVGIDAFSRRRRQSR